MVYGFNQNADRETLWCSLKEYHSRVRGPCLVGGDFNSVMAADERIGGALVTSAETNGMKKAILKCELFYMKGYGSFYTWNNKHEFEGKVYSRVDRVFINEDWLHDFPDSNAHFLPEGLFDHCPCLVNFTEHMPRSRPPFKYFNMWSKAPDFENIILRGWALEIKGTAMFRIITKLKWLKKELKGLNNSQFSDIENLVKVTELSLNHFQTLLRNDLLNESFV
ncbi:uncharacterized protein LOC141590373 [Silene latifolia]|uniref:uncharacterized protein LOC141590373 n=1 Tax=Silene latifolia TaxID=37657 RepID=UPI003D7813D8